MAKPERRKVSVWVWRRGPPDELLVCPHVSKGREEEGPLLAEIPSTGSWEETVARLVEALLGVRPARVVDLQLPNEFEVKKGPSAGAWSERFLAAEVPPGTPAAGGVWKPHYEAKAGAASPRARDAVTRLRDSERLKP